MSCFRASDFAFTDIIAAPKAPIKRLPVEVEVSPDATVEDVKVLIAKAVGLSDHHRVGLFDLETRKTLKDRQARIADIPAVVAAGEVSVKDLGTSGPALILNFC